jgi:polysaccharide export outer membrane protein
MSKYTLAVGFLLVLSAAAAFAQRPANGSSPVETHASSVDKPASDKGHPELQQRFPRYEIQRQDVLLLTFPLTPEFNQTVTVQPDGYINLQNSGSLHAQGLTVPELASAIQQAYKGILHEPIVNVDLADFQKPFYTVIGQVAKPGQYELRADITVAEALAVAGGMIPTAKMQVFLFHRTSPQWFEVKRVNLQDFLHGKHVNEVPAIQPGDMIFVPEKFIVNFRKYVPYTVNAGSYLTTTP